MSDLDRALADIVAIRAQIARGSSVCGPGSATLAATGMIAASVMVGQIAWLDDPGAQPMTFFGLWGVSALLALALVSIETVRRSRQLHSGLGNAMVMDAFEAVLPSIGAGACLGLVIARFAPDALWMLPGLWQVLTGLGLFAAARFLPRAVGVAAAWYLLAGLCTLAIASGTQTLSPWLMGLPFALGQAGLALIMHREMRSTEAADADR